MINRIKRIFKSTKSIDDAVSKAVNGGFRVTGSVVRDGAFFVFGSKVVRGKDKIVVNKFVPPEFVERRQQPLFGPPRF